MYVVGFSGPERIGKTTFINDVCRYLQNEWGYDCLVIPEVTMRPENMLLDLNNLSVQEYLLYSQIASEAILFASTAKDIVLIDRPPIDILPYIVYSHGLRGGRRQGAELMERTSLDWVISKYDLLFYFNYSFVVPLVGKHFSECDLKLWKKRSNYLKSLVSTIHKRPKPTLNTKFISIGVPNSHVTETGDYIANKKSRLEKNGIKK